MDTLLLHIAKCMLIQNATKVIILAWQHIV